MPFPNTRQALREHGYEFDHTKVCPSCNVTIEMWITPRDRMMPLDFKRNDRNEEICEPHFATCKDPAQYSSRLREQKEKKAAAGSDQPIVT
jgi:hypothetical protein